MNATTTFQRRVFDGLVGRFYHWRFSQVQQYEALCTAQAVAKDWFGYDSPEAVGASLKTAHLLFTLGESNRATALIESAVRQCVSHEHVRQADALFVVNDLKEAGELPLAERVLTRVIGIEKAQEFPLSLESMNRALVHVLAAQGKFDAADEACERTGEYAAIWKSVHPHERDLTLGDLSFLQRRYDEAAAHYTRGLQAKWSDDGPDSRRLDDTMRCLGKSYLCMGRIEEGREILYRNLRNQERELHPHLRSMALWRTAEEFYRCYCFEDVLTLLDSHGAKARIHPGQLRIIAYASLGSGDRERARFQARAALETVRQHREAGDVYGARELEWIADLHFAMGERAMALQCLEEACSLLGAVLGEDSQWAARLRFRLEMGYAARRVRDAGWPVICAPWRPSIRERPAARTE